ncbi:DUF1848 domain-containing protein [Pelosinus baikalensis]|uniref:DUF1848 domain-containing protein n=1 Tax=Pelosinus baikalensis TaxID=2892015 RepID=A0ABS8HQQ6_9FIRM|nr:DUF1848 domain-containing protein [Pelosinus baikalensis]MCC5465517.1 DUF1848 domain-containing protein [Pelosinus baikalensis]
MIISASRRTDIPAFYSDWIVNRLKEGFVYTTNPMNPKQVSKVPLTADVVDCIVFWTKNAQPMLNKLDVINGMGYSYYFQFTITPYDHRIEQNLADKTKIMEGFKALSEKIGRQRVIWRYDPVIINNSFSVEYHLEQFYNMCSFLKDYTTKCIFSFVELYAKIRKRTKGIIDQEVDFENRNKIAYAFSEIAKGHKLSLETCSEKIDFSNYGIMHSSCINQTTIENIIGYSINGKRDLNQRPHCGCIESIDIGAYDCCSHGCVYCYAASNENKIYQNIQQHNRHSPLLLDQPYTDYKIRDRVVTSLKNGQVSLF